MPHTKLNLEIMILLYGIGIILPPPLHASYFVIYYATMLDKYVNMQGIYANIRLGKVRLG